MRGRFIILSTLILASPLSAQSGMEGSNERSSRIKQIDKRITKMRIDAEAGNVNAEVDLASYYLIVMKDFNEAAKWYRKASRKGSPEAQFNLGYLYITGRGVPQNFVEAERWYRKAALQGHAEAQFRLGELLENGQGLVQDYSEAAVWYRKASLRGWSDAQYALGYLYSQGLGVPEDPSEAYIWFSLAVASQPSYEKEETKMKSRDEAAKALSPEARERAQTRAREIYDSIQRIAGRK